MRGERGEQRRTAIIETLRRAKGPVLGADLAIEFNVSRQVLVQDTAILRAAGYDVIATPRGYLLNDDPGAGYHDVWRCQVTRETGLALFTILADCGVRVTQISVEHPLYGVLSAPLSLSSRHDASEHMQTLERTGTGDLYEITGGRCTLDVIATKNAALQQGHDSLAAQGFLAG